MQFSQKQQSLYQDLSNCIKILAADAIECAQSGHPGMVLGMSDVMTILVHKFLKFNPQDPKWFDRDRLVLSAGHGSLLLYTFYYLCNYRNFNIDDLKQFRQLNSKTPGHPEYKAYDAIETTTGPLGQGLANAVGMAIAQKKYSNKLGQNLCNHKIYVIVGDGCLMEGISYEAASIAGHLGLNNLIVLFDDNKISIDGSTSLSTSDDHIKRFEAQGWNTISIDGHNFDAINIALSQAMLSEKPCFISCATVIARGCVLKEGSESSHGSPLGTEAVLLLKEFAQFKQEPFSIPIECKIQWENAWRRNEEQYQKWQLDYHNLDAEAQKYCELPSINTDALNSVINEEFHTPEATRASSSKVINMLMTLSDKIICGSADLSLSVGIKNTHSKVITKNDFSGNFIHYGVREHAMSAIMNGLALSGFLPISGTFFVFSDYMRPAMRLSSLMKLQVIYLMTHDSIGVGEDGPTHQPVEHLASCRAMPNLLVMRPADLIETIECWKIALNNKNTPSLIILTRQQVQPIRLGLENNGLESENLSNKGCYIINSCSAPYDIKLFASGSEVALARDVYQELVKHGLSVQLISVPCMELFYNQSKEYKANILSNAKFKIAIEAASFFGWSNIIGENGLFFGVNTFGLSAPYKQIYDSFGLTKDKIIDDIMHLVYRYLQ